MSGVSKRGAWRWRGAAPAVPPAADAQRGRGRCLSYRRGMHISTTTLPQYVAQTISQDKRAVCLHIHVYVHETMEPSGTMDGP